MSITGIDCSKHNGVINWHSVANSGIKFIIQRAGYGNTIRQEDTTCIYNIKNALANGIKVGVYYFSYALSVNDAEQEAVICNQIIKPYKDKIFAVFFDYEYDSVKYYKRMKGISPTNKFINQCHIAFRNKIKSFGYKAGIYYNNDYRKNILTQNTINLFDYKWLADYSGGADAPCDFQQTSSNGKVNGVNGRVDIDIFYGVIDKNIPTRCDTIGNFKVEIGTNYTFKVTSGSQPVLNNGSSSFKLVKQWNDGNDYLFTFKAVGKIGDGCGFYLNGGKSPIAIATIVNAYIDTGSLTLNAYGKYIYMIKSRGTPVFRVGTPGFVDLKLIKRETKDTNYYYYQVSSNGRLGTIGAYLNGQRIGIINIISAPFVSDTNMVSIAHGKDYQIKVTCNTRPSLISENSNIVQVENYCKQQAKNYFMKIKAVGYKGQKCKVFINGNKVKPVIVTVV